MTPPDPAARRPPRAVMAALQASFARPFDNPLDDAAFDRLARDIFAWQFGRNDPFAAYCTRRGRTPDSVMHWSEIPAVPTAAFREVALIAGRREDAEAVFRTSGTTKGGERRGEHYIADIAVYDNALLAAFAAMLLPDGVRPMMISLVPPPRDLPDSSLGHMIATVMAGLGSPDSRTCASVAHGMDTAALDDALRQARQSGEPACLLGTSFSFVHWLDALAAGGRTCRLPDGSRLMDTGGFKGRSREVDADAMRAAYLERFAIAPDFAINEYGMTELCSQFYDTTLRERVLGGRPGLRRKQAPPWVRTRVVDPATLEPLPHGRQGLLQHFDLANAGSVIAVQTEDIGVIVDGGFRVIGRAHGATPRGCSIAMDDLLTAVRERAPRR